MPVAAEALGGLANRGGAADFKPDDLCALVQPALQGADLAQRTQALGVLRESGVRLAPESPCVQALSAAAADDAAPPVIRAGSITTLAAVTGSVPWKIIKAAMEDKDAGVRIAAVTAFGHPGGGRAALYRLQPMLADKAPEVRAATGAAMVRASGDLALPFVQPLFKERDNRAVVAMAPELGRLKSPESADMLAKIAARPGPEVRLAVAHGVAERHDDHARALRTSTFEAIRKDPYAPAELRALLYADASPEELLKDPRDPLLGPLGFKGLVHGKRYREAVDWLVASYDRLSPETLIDVLAAWLANAPGVPATTTTAGRRSGV